MSPDERPLASYGRSLHRAWRLVATGAVLGLLGGAALTLTQEPTYSARADVLVAPRAIDTDPLAGDAAVEPPGMDTEAAIATSVTVGAAIADAVGGTSAAGAASRVQVSVPANSSILVITYTDSSARRAQEGTQAAADGFLAERGRILEAFQAARKETIDERLALVRKDLDAQQALLLGDSLDDDARRSDRRRLNSLAATAGTLQEHLNTLAAADLSPGQVVLAPGLPERPTGPDQSVPLTSGLGLGLLAGLGAHALRMRRGRSTGSPWPVGDDTRDTDLLAPGAHREPPAFAHVRLTGAVGSLDDAPPLADPAEARLRRLVHPEGGTPPRTMVVTEVTEGAASRRTGRAAHELAERLVAEAGRSRLSAQLVDLDRAAGDDLDPIARTGSAVPVTVIVGSASDAPDVRLAASRAQLTLLVAPAGMSADEVASALAVLSSVAVRVELVTTSTGTIVPRHLRSGRARTRIGDQAPRHRRGDAPVG